MHRPAPPTQASSRQVQGRGQGGGGGGGQSGGVLKLNVAIAGEFSMGNFGNQQWRDTGNTATEDAGPSNIKLLYVTGHSFRISTMCILYVY